MIEVQPKKLQRLLLVLMILAGLSLLPNISTYDFRGEEPRRLLVAYEMAKAGTYMQPTVFGEPYFNKPPLFNWIVMASARIVGWNVLAVRVPSLLAVLLTTLLVYWFSLRLYRDRTNALLSGLVFLTSLDILYWYGWLGEIDATMALFVSLMIFWQFLYFERQQGLFLVAAGLLAGAIFLLKGFVILAFFGISLLTMALYRKQFSRLFSLPALLSYGGALGIALLWTLQIPAAGQYLKTLANESAQRVGSSGHIALFVKHLLVYPFLTIKQTLPSSLFVLYAVVIGRTRLHGTSKMLVLVCLFNYLPFLLAAGSRGRYILPLFPLASVLASRVILDASATRKRFLNAFLSFIALIIIGRFLFGVFWLPFQQERRDSPKRVAEEISKVIDLSRPTACECVDHFDICLYLDIFSGQTLKAPSVTRDWEYLVTCRDSTGGEVLKTFRTHKTVVSVRRRY